MNFNVNKFDNQLETYIKKLKKNGTMQIELEEREERKLYYQKYDESRLNYLYIEEIIGGDEKNESND